MDLPKLSPGKRYALPRPPGPADALLLARLAEREKAAGRLTAIVTSGAADAQRLMDELAFFAPDLRCTLFPDWETLPYDTFSPHQDLISERLATLWRISQGEADMVIVPATTALYRVAPPAFLAGYTFQFQVRQKLQESKLKAQLTLAGYNHVTQVVSPGEYAVRGGLIDLFPMGSLVPFRVDLFDDEIDSIRTFDPDSQRSLYPVPEVRLLPGREFPMDDDARAKFRSRWRELLEGDPTKSRIYKDMGNGVATAGIEYYLPLFFDQTATVFDYLGTDATLVLHGDLEPAFQRFWQDTKDRHRVLQGDPERPILPPEALFLSVEQFYSRANEHAQLALRPAVQDVADSALFQKLPEMAVVRGADDPLARLKQHLAATPHRVLLLAESKGRRESLLDFVRASQLSPPAFDSLAQFQASDEKLGLVTGALTEGFSWPQEGLDFVTETELFAAGPTTRRRKRQEQVSDVEALIKDLSELNVGDPVVHTQHGIGRYRGLVNLALGQGTNQDGSPAVQEFLHLEYADKATLYVPVSQLHQISRYTGVSADEAPLHKLGSGQWEKARRRAAEQVRETAAELLNIYARRAAREGHAFRFSAQDYEVFANDFGFEETADQNAAIHAVIQDMISPQPMDRLVCGDVGFGKTEVALRAAFIAITGGRQVAFLAPTTLLAEQHYQTLVDRFSKWPVKVAEVSRFRSGKEVNATIKGLADGSVDIVVGTHKLLSESTKFKNLGLLIIDEEHRLGVRHKEAMKAMRAEVDVLTLTATPIPRTLHQSLAGLRDMTLMQTPPRDRSPVLTFVEPLDDALIEEAVSRELDRGGQVFFVHNRIETIEAMSDHLRRIVPRARIAVGHGQMREKELEEVMRRFVTGEVDVLLSTLIVESGLDVPNANTMFVNRADHFGLAQLYQLRGRVGRSHRRAYCYLVVPDNVDEDAERRLQVLEHHTELGSGYRIALKDMELRGAGNLLGPEQSGFVHAVGFDLYLRMLEETVKRVVTGGTTPRLVPADVSLDVPAYLPDDYVPQGEAKLDVYRRLTRATEAAEIESIKAEVRDRFGPLPTVADAFFATAFLRIIGGILGVEGVIVRGNEARITFRADAVPRMKGLSAAFHDVQFQVEVRRAHPLSLKLTRLGGAELLDGLVRALRGLLG